MITRILERIRWLGPIIALLGGLPHGALAEDPVCLYVSSYHQGFAWSDGIERGLRRVINGQCRVVQFDMDTWRRSSEADKHTSAAVAFGLVQRIAPAVIITSDDNAAKYFILPYLRNLAIPVVFSGVNWSVEEYDLPVDNVTGIVEVAPLEPMLEHVLTLSGNGRDAIYLAADVLSERKNFKHITKAAHRYGIRVDGVFVSHFAQWCAALANAQSADFVIIGGATTIDGWNTYDARVCARTHSRRPSVTNDRMMMSVSHLGYTKIDEELGEWAGKSAMAILAGSSASSIPLVTNRKWDKWINEALLDLSGLAIPERHKRKAKTAY